MMKRLYDVVALIVFFVSSLLCSDAASLHTDIDQEYADANGLILFTPENSFFQYSGRIDFSNRSLPAFWAPGVYIRAAFQGSACEILLNDEVLWGHSHNYISVAIDDLPPVRVILPKKNNSIKIDTLAAGNHIVTICKSTESGIGRVEFAGLRCVKLLPLPSIPLRKIEFIGNSITCGAGSDESVVPCNSGQWYDQHNAYMSYGPVTARSLNAEWMLTAVSGIGLTRSCCGMTLTMPDVFDKVSLSENKLLWDFTYQPDVVTVCLGQNDGIQDSTVFCSTYVGFIQQLRSRYPETSIVCLTSPMADEQLTFAMKKYIHAVVEACHERNDLNVYEYFFAKRYFNGCGTHPDLKEHQLIAGELSTFIRKLKQW
jgi:lysophospholipase L1-like esterase